MTSVVAYIDGFNLYYGMKSRFGRRHLWLDVVKLVRRLRPNDEVVLVRYFTAIVKGDLAAAQNQLDYLDAMRAANGPLLDVRLGRFKDRPTRVCRRCGRPYECRCGRVHQSWEEKETDVALGAMMVADAAMGRAETTMLVTADTDLAPALAAVRMVVPEQKIYLAMPPGSTRPSSRLTAVGDVGHFFINGPALRNSQLPHQVTDGSGRAYKRPEKWS